MLEQTSGDHLDLVNPFLWDVFDAAFLITLDHGQRIADVKAGIVDGDIDIDLWWFFTDFEWIRRGPLVTDLGVIALDIWNGIDIKDFCAVSKQLIQGYLTVGHLTDYDQQCLVNFSIRYLFSDENWF